MSKAKQVQKYITDMIHEIIPDGDNKKLYQDLFKSMSDKDFKQLMTDIKEGKKHLVIVTPIYGKIELDLKRNQTIAKKHFNHQFFQRLWIGPKDNQPKYLTPIKYLVVDLPFRRASQTLIKKIAVPKHNKAIDQLTFQPTGDSKGAKISYNELQILAGYDLDKSVIELIKYRGGDRNGYIALNAMIDKYGIAKQKVIEPYSSGVESTKVLKTYLTAMHLRNTL